MSEEEFYKFVVLVYGTRAAQKEYFKKKGQERLAQAKHLEAELDRKIKEIMRDLPLDD